MGFSFDFNEFKATFHSESFGLGVFAGWATAYALYRARHALGSARSAISDQASSAQEYASRGADSRYIGDLLKYIQVMHLAGKTVNLSEIVVEPHFLHAPELIQPEEDDIIQTVFHVVPQIHDHPYLHAPYNLPTLSIDELDNGDRSIALLGLPGSGRTTALMTIALWSLGEVKFEPPVDKVQERLNEEDAASKDDEERAQRIRDRLTAEKMALESLATKRGVSVEAITGEGRTGGLSLRQMTPMYAHCSNILFQGREFGRTVDPAEPLLRAIQQHVSSVTARTLPPNFYARLNEGKILLLLDGFDEVPSNQQSRLLNWLEAYQEQYSNNMLIVTGPANGYGSLLRAGLSPLFLRPWNDVHTERLADTWAEHWGKINNKRRQAELDERTLASAKSRNRARTPFDLTMKLWSTYLTQETTTFEDRMNNLLTHMLPNDSLEKWLPKLATASALQLDEGYFTPRRMAEVLTDLAPLPTVATDEEVVDELELEDEVDDLDDFDDDLDDLADLDEDLDDDELDNDGEDLDDLLDDEDDDLDVDDEIDLDDDIFLGDEETIAKRTDLTPDAKKLLSKATKEYQKWAEDMQKSGMIVRYRKGRYQIRHPLIAAYLASLTFKDADEFDRDEALLEKAFEPAWQDALAFAAAHTPIDAVVQARMDAKNDVLQNTLLDTTRWLAHAPNANWRKPLFQALGKLLIAPNQYLSTRERIAAALIGTRDRNVMVIFKRALNNRNPDVRRLACLAAGALEAEKVLPELTELLIDDNENVTLSAGLALGAIGTEPAIDEMWAALTDENSPDSLRKAIAEAFAAIPDEGYPIIFNAANAENYLLRRAAVFGLRRINTSWALIALHRRSIEDDQWFVRSAAETAFEEMQYGDSTKGVQPYPAVESIGWLREWIMGLGEEAGEAESGDSSQLLQKAMDSNEPDLQRLSAANMGQLGMAAYTGLLYKALRVRDDAVREAAFRALGDIQQHVGQGLPSPV
jgi:HEAT repeat protein